MGIDLFWDGKEQSVFLLEFKGKWTWDDLDAVLQVTRRICLERQQLIGAILDFRESMRFPVGAILAGPGPSEFFQLLRISRNGEAYGPLVIVGMRGIVRALIDTVGKFHQSTLNNVRFAESMSEARQIMRAEMQQRPVSVPMR